ncbi:ATP-binding cassette domain-containing protein [Pseudonocardia sp. NPDC049635]|uniref:ATP-binding cassette domain-containing protein n=1 Tax=Pseudonocardia sp. NPDC049635 TaxID=3155506 RepID=UPI0033E7FDCB
MASTHDRRDSLRLATGFEPRHPPICCTREGARTRSTMIATSAALEASRQTTLARVVTGLQRSRGTVALDGKPLTRRGRLRASAVVMQDVQRQLFSDTVRGEIELAATDASHPTDVTALLEQLDLAAVAERHPPSLSGGQQQRLVIAAARITGRRVVVFDEPSSGVDRHPLCSPSRNGSATWPTAVLSYCSSATTRISSRSQPTCSSRSPRPRGLTRRRSTGTTAPSPATTGATQATDPATPRLLRKPEEPLIRHTTASAPEQES